MTLTQGSPVYHGSHHGIPGHGLGTVVEEWGAYHICRHCNEEVPPAVRMKCPKCGVESAPLQINGKDIFDIKFADGTWSICQDWLRSPRRGS